jgi:hypothetical protein
MVGSICFYRSDFCLLVFQFMGTLESLSRVKTEPYRQYAVNQGTTDLEIHSVIPRIHFNLVPACIQKNILNQESSMC